MLEFGEGQFDGIEVRAVRWQVDQLGAGRLDGHANASHFMSSEVVHDDGVTRAKCRDQLLLDVSQEDSTIHGAIDDQRGGDAVRPQRSNERGRFPVAVRDFVHHALPTPGPPLATGHLGVGTCFIDEYHLVRVKMRLPIAPSGAALGHIGPVLFSGPQDFF